MGMSNENIKKRRLTEITNINKTKIEKNEFKKGNSKENVKSTPKIVEIEANQSENIDLVEYDFENGIFPPDIEHGTITTDNDIDAWCNSTSDDGDSYMVTSIHDSDFDSSF